MISEEQTANLRSAIRDDVYKELGDCIELIIDHRGKTPKKLGGDWTSQGIRAISAKNVNGGRLVNENTIRHVSHSMYKKWMKEDVKVGDCFLVSEGATLGECMYWDYDYPVVLSQRIFCIRTNPEILYPRYFYAYMNSEGFQSEIIGRSTGSSVFGLRQTDLLKMKVKILPLEQQKVIGDTHYNLNKKIELNRQINQTLEQIAQTIFKSWFVDFEPVKAKSEAKAAGRDPERAAMCAISGKLEPELDQLTPEQYQQLAATAALFPDALLESELGLIPVGWEVKSVSDVSKFATGKIDVSTLSVDNYISTENMLENKGGVGFASSLPSVPKVPNFSRGQVLISNIRPYFKKIWLARFDGGRSNDVLCFESFEEDCIEFLYNLFYQDEFFDFMMRTSKGAKMPRGDKNAIAGWKFACAGHALRSWFSEKVRPYYSYIESLNAEVQKLSHTRDALLPKLLSGEVGVR